MKIRRLVLMLALAGAAASFALWPGRAPRAKGPLKQDVYVWQRAWTGPVTDAVSRHSASFGCVVALGAEIAFRNGRTDVVRPTLDYPALRRAGVPIGLALRIGPCPGPFSSGARTTAGVAGLAHLLVNEARAAGIEPRELHIDFDCAESRLDGYRTWVDAIRAQAPGVPVIITALPSWLDRPAFARLARASDGYVLQVHSLQRPAGADDPWTLCDVPNIGAIVEKAARLGVRFRVALPTYGYKVAFTEQGRFAAIHAEGPEPAWPAGWRLREVRADPAALAARVAGWAADRPAALTGIIWYRLPVESDRLNWSWPALASVMAGAAPAPDLRASARRGGDGAVEVWLANAGTDDARLAVDVTLSWDGAPLRGSDGLGGFEPVEPASGRLRLRARPELALQRLPPGGQRTIGWLRLNPEQEVRCDVAAIHP